MSRRGDYSVRAALYLARTQNRNEATKVKEIVAEMGIPASFASQILAELVRADIATSKPGREGGYRLIRDPSSISLLELVEAAEGPLRTDHCALGQGPCRWDTVCPLHQSWQATVATVRDQLATVTLAAIVAEDIRLEGVHEGPPDSHRSFHNLAEQDSSYAEISVEDLDHRLSRLHDQELFEEFYQAMGTREELATFSLSMAYLLDNGHRLILELVGADEETIRIELDLSPLGVDPQRAELKGQAIIRTNISFDPAPVIRLILNRLARLCEKTKTL